MTDAGGVSSLAKITGVSANTVKQWRRVDSIPAPYWRIIADHGVATLDELADAVADRARARAINDDTPSEAAA